jgi:hypothetical protein
MGWEMTSVTESAKLRGGPDDLVDRKCIWEVVREIISEVEFNACLNE